MFMGIALAVLMMACAPVQTGPGYYQEREVVVQTTTYYPETCTIHVGGEIAAAEMQKRVDECNESARYTEVPPHIVVVRD